MQWRRVSCRERGRECAPHYPRYARLRCAPAFSRAYNAASPVPAARPTTMRILCQAVPAIALACALVIAAGAGAADTTYPPTARKPGRRHLPRRRGHRRLPLARGRQRARRQGVDRRAEQGRRARYLDGYRATAGDRRARRRAAARGDGPALRLRVSPATVRDEARAAREPADARRAAGRRQHRQGSASSLDPNVLDTNGPHDDRLLPGRRYDGKRVVVSLSDRRQRRRHRVRLRRGDAASGCPTSCRA